MARPKSQSKKIYVAIRLDHELLAQIKANGTVTEVITSALTDYFKNKTEVKK